MRQKERGKVIGQGEYHIQKDVSRNKEGNKRGNE